MPTKNENTIEWGSGTLYFYPPEGGDPVPVGPVKGMTETIELENPDTPDLPAPLHLSLTQTLSFEAELEVLNLPLLWRLIRDPALPVRWARQNHPRLLHLTKYAKTARRREKNMARLARLFLKED